MGFPIILLSLQQGKKYKELQKRFYRNFSQIRFVKIVVNLAIKKASLWKVGLYNLAPHQHNIIISR